MRLRLSDPVWRYGLAVVAVVGLGVVLLPLRSVVPAEAVMLAFVPVVVAVSRISSVGVSVAAAIAGFLTLDFLFVPPYYRFTIGSVTSWIALVVFLAVAIITGLQTVRLRQREQAALSRQRELELLNRASFRAVSEESPEAVGGFVVGHVVSLLGARRAALFAGHGDGAAELLAEAGSEPASDEEQGLVIWVLRQGKAVGLPARAVPPDQRPVSVRSDEAIPGLVANGVYVPLQTAQGLEGVLVAVPPQGGVTPDGARLIAALANLSAAFLERRRLEEGASHAEALREADRLKTTLVSSVSHELKTPLAAASARVTGLLDEEAGCRDDRVREELTAVSQDLVRLDSSIRDLLDISRLESASWEQRCERFDIREILAAVRERLPAESRGRVSFELADIVPEVVVDFAQLARAIANIVENAVEYTPADSPVIVSLAETVGGDAEIVVEDVGPGIPDQEKKRVFEKFYRGSSAARVPGGSGLGLAIAREIVQGNGGTIRVEDAKPHGARFVIVLPRAQEERQ